jgi:formate hydrogenlyase subunit 4
MKAAFQTRQGPPLLQVYYDLAKLLHKEPVRSETASWVFAAGPRVYFSTAVSAAMLVPVLFAGAPLEQAGGILVLVGLLALGRFALATASLDTGSPFGGMGASREMTVAALAEPALMLGLFAVALWGPPCSVVPPATRASSSPRRRCSSSSSPRPGGCLSTTRRRTSS